MLANVNSVMGSWTGALAGIGLLLLVIFIYSQLKRREERRAQAFALAHSVDFLDDDIPADLPAELVEALPSGFTVRNCFSGVRLGERTVSFDYVLGSSNLKYVVTVAAVKQKHPERFIDDPRTVEVTRAGDWAIVRKQNVASRSSRKTVNVVELWDLLRTTTDEDVAAVLQSERSHTNLHIAPRHQVHRGNRR